MNMDNRLSLMAGLMIGLGAYGFLALGGIPGAVIFAFGLVVASDSPDIVIIIPVTPAFT